MAPRARNNSEAAETVDPVDEAMTEDRKGLAEELAGVLAGLEGIASETIRGLIYKIPQANGKFHYVRDVYPPFDPPEIMASLKEEYGGGDYQLRIMVDKKIRKNINFSILENRNAPLIAPAKSDSSDMIAILMQMNAASKSDMMQMMQMQMQMAQASQQSQMAMLTALLPAMMGNKEKTSELLTSFAALSQGGKDSGGMKEAIETLVAAKSLFSGDGGDKGGFDPDDSMVSNALKLAGPLLGGLARSVQERGAKQETVQLLPQPGNPGVTHMPPQPVLMPPSIPANIDPPNTDDAPSPFPVLDLIREDVLFFFRRGYDAEVAAENVLDILDKNQVEDEALTDVIAAFTVSANWIEDLAGYGIDLRANPVWANTFLSSLVTLYTAPRGEDDYSGGGTGGAQDAANHGGLGAEGLADNASEEPGGSDHG